MATGIIVPSTELQATLDDQLAGYYADGALMKLFSNNVTPALGSTTATFTEATFSGYAAQAVGAWGAASFSSSKARAEASPLTFTNSTGAVGNTIYGYYVVDSTETELLFAHKPDNGPFDMSAAGASLTITPKYTRGDDPSPD